MTRGDIDWEALRAQAAQVRANAHAPYSNFRVGAALLADESRVFLGTNVENASYGLALCAERAAVSAAVSAGVRTFRALALVTDASAPATPCGMCRQVLAEFPPSFPVRSYAPDGTHLERTVAQLLPDAFRL